MPPTGAQWLHEIKWDGYRLLATVKAGRARLWSRNGIEWSARLPDICQAVEALGVGAAALDGELVAGSGTAADFNLLQAVLAGERQGHLHYVLFDLLNLDGVDVTAAPLLARKALLRELLGDARGHLSFSAHVQGDGATAFRLAVEHRFEGIICKRADRPYQHGRSNDWRKIKQLASDEFAVAGYTAPRGSRTGFGALLLARPDPVHGWVYAGRVGTGFNDAQLRALSKRLAGAGSRTPTVHVGVADPQLRAAIWFQPRFVVEVFYRGMGRQQLLRQPSLKTVRSDKSVAALRADRDRAAGRDTQLHGPRRRAEGNPMKPHSAKSTRGRSRAGDSEALPVLSSPGKILYPDSRLSKQDVWSYYLAVAQHLLPEIAGRPLSVIRCPAGIGKACFFQKHLSPGFERVATVQLTEESGARADYLVVEDVAGLMELVQFNALEFHPWGAHAADAGRADRIVFDLDPGAGVSFEEVKQAARDMRRLLAGLELESFVRVSGGKGLHVVVPLNPGCAWPLVKRFAHGFADALAQAQPQRFLAVASKRLRDKRIFIDYLRNGRGATAVASYSLRARPGAPVAMPVAWNALARLGAADAFTLQDVPRRLARRRTDPWRDMDRIRQDLSRWADDDDGDGDGNVGE